MLQIAVLDAGGMEPLISLLQSIDPDVQKNALETLALMLQDHQARTAIRAQGGITPVLQMLKSEYPGIYKPLGNLRYARFPFSKGIFGRVLAVVQLFCLRFNRVFTAPLLAL